jgi:CheY-like chemotaxis protein
VSEHILVVDDDPNIREMVTLVLESAGGYPVETAANGAETVEAIAQDPPSAMLLDMQMPVLDGWGLPAGCGSQAGGYQRSS